MSEQPSSGLARLIRIVNAVEDGLLVIVLAAMILVAGIQIVLRNFFDSGMVWADPALRLMVLWVGMIGAMVATRYDKQISVDVASRFLPARWRVGVRVLTDLFTTGVAGLVAWHAVRMVLEERAAGGEVFASVPLWFCEAVIPVAFAVICIRYALFAVRHIRESLHEGEG